MRVRHVDDRYVVSIPQRDFGEFQHSLANLHPRQMRSFQSLKGILVNFNVVAFLFNLRSKKFQSLKGILVNFNFSCRGKLKNETSFNPSKGFW
ncbi:Epoxyqueuosine (oQ) reductase QueG [Geitlerinema sp. FC II]|nr:Epoxyqueuosine (oQ) reductase QueG [Geitlerinema sp. FC II]